MAMTANNNILAKQFITGLLNRGEHVDQAKLDMS
jgi:hypothetical protein